uniref:Uncharacterized protein n=1 Tax=Methanococcus maripaludis TaxID=39152 RepID=O50250_METMI|nr:hypothetical protein [Methanococcus maripaludis]
MKFRKGRPKILRLISEEPQFKLFKPVGIPRTDPVSTTFAICCIVESADFRTESEFSVIATVSFSIAVESSSIFFTVSFNSLYSRASRIVRSAEADSCI